VRLNVIYSQTFFNMHGHSNDMLAGRLTFIPLNDLHINRNIALDISFNNHAKVFQKDTAIADLSVPYDQGSISGADSVRSTLSFELLKCVQTILPRM
jgi:hypothetical protein